MCGSRGDMWRGYFYFYHGDGPGSLFVILLFRGFSSMRFGHRLFGDEFYEIVVGLLRGPVGRTLGVI